MDLGQVIIATLIAAVGYLLKFEIASFAKRLDKHEEVIVGLVGDVQRLIGINWGTTGEFRRWNDRSKDQ